MIREVAGLAKYLFTALAILTLYLGVCAIIHLVNNYLNKKRSRCFSLGMMMEAIKRIFARA